MLPVCEPSLLQSALTFATGLIAGVGGSFVALRITRSNRAAHGSSVVDQSGAHAGGDNVGGDKTTTQIDS